MTARVFGFLAVAVLVAVLQSTAAARPAKAEQQRKEEEEEEQPEAEAPAAQVNDGEEQEERKPALVQRQAPKAEKQPHKSRKASKASTAVIQKKATQVPENANGANGGDSPAPANDQAGDGTPAPAEKTTGTGAYHLTPDGAKNCDFGVTVTETKCKEVGAEILQDMKIKPGRDYLVSGKLSNAPPGCSLNTQMDWAVTYNTNTEGDNDGSYAAICHGKKKEVHGVKEGESECDFGEPVKVDKCLDAVNSVLHTIAGEEPAKQTIVNAGHWNTLPAGCSMHAGAGSEQTRTEGGGVAYYNTKKDAKNDGSYVLVCTGTVVPVR